MNSIKKTAAVWIAVLLLVTSLVLGAVTYNKARGALVETLKTALSAKAEDAARLVGARLAEVEADMAAVARSYDGQGSLSGRLAYLAREAEHSGYRTIGVVDSRGRMRLSTGQQVDVSQQPYFATVKNGATIVTEPMASPFHEGLIVAVAVPLHVGDTIGIVGFLEGDTWSQLLQDTAIGETGYAFMIDQRGTIIAHQDYDMVVNQENIAAAAAADPQLQRLFDIQKSMVDGHTGASQYTYDGAQKILGYAPVPGTTWSIGVGAEGAEVLQHVHGIERFFAVFLVIILVAGIFGAIVLGGYLARPISRMAHAADRLAAYDLTVSFSERDLRRKDEIGQLARAFSGTLQTLRSTMGATTQVAQQLARYSLELSDSAGIVGANMQEVTASTEEIASGMEAISASAQEVAASSQEMTASLNQLTQEVTTGDDRTREVKERAQQLKQRAANSAQASTSIYNEIGQEVTQAIERMAVVQEISDLTQTISAIAAQTNLLSLNAAIEAARAGDAGSGFAVVAEEVRQLANNTAQAVSHISGLTNEVQEASQHLVAASNRLLAFIDETVMADYDDLLAVGQQYEEDADTVLAITTRSRQLGEQVLHMVQEVNLAIESIAATVNQSAAGASEISHSSQQTSQSMGQVSGLSEQLATASRDLLQLVEQFKLEEAAMKEE